MWISQPRNRVSSIILRINAKILDYSRFLNLRNNLNLYYDATPLFVAKIFVFHISIYKTSQTTIISVAFFFRFHIIFRGVALWAVLTSRN